MTWILLAAVAAPAIAAALVAASGSPAFGGHGGPRDAGGAARSLSIWASALLVAASVAVLVEVAASGRLDLVATDADGRATFGLTAGRVEASLLLLTSFVGLVVQAFAARSLAGDARAPRFHALALLLVASTNLAAVAASGTTFAVGWIVTSLTVVALIGHRSGWSVARAATRRTRNTLAIGDLALLVGIIVATVSAGHLDLRALDDVVLQTDSAGAIAMIGLLLVVAGMVRSALIPFARWLPSTLAAPTPVSALLHAGVVNGAGVLLIRFHPVITETAAPLVVAYVAGVATAVIATAVMIVRTDVKGGLVWSTVGQMGFMVAQIGAGAFAAAFFHLIGHAMYKAAAFLGAGGAIDALARDRVRPARHAAPSVGAAAVSLVIAAGSVAVALVVLDPHLTDAATVLVATFATLTLARAVHGWVAGAAVAAAVALPAAVAGAFAAGFAYVGGLTVVERFIIDEVPFEVPNAVGAGWVVATLAAIAVAAIVVTRLPGQTGDDLRRAVYTRLLGYGSTPTSTPRSTPASAAPPGTRAPVPTPTVVGPGALRGVDRGAPDADSNTESSRTTVTTARSAR